MIISITKLKILSEIYRDIGQVFLASLFVTPLASKEINWVIIFMGLILSVFYWWLSLLVGAKYE